MPIAKESGSTFTPAPAGTHVARCIGVISLGTQQPNSPQFNAAFKVMLIWELPNEMLGDSGKAMTVSAEFTCSLGEKANLRHILESWRGRAFTKEELAGFDVNTVLDKPCMVSVIHKESAKGRTYAAVNAVTTLPKGTTCPARVNPLQLFEIEHGRNEVFKALPEFVQNKIAASDEWMLPAQPVAEPEHDPADGGESDSVPF